MARKRANSKPTKFTWDEVRQHNTLESCWVVVRNKVYDVTKYTASHPGGQFIFTLQAGHDITYLMETSHPFTRTPWDILEKYCIGEVDAFVPYKDEEPFWNEIKDEVGAYFERTGKDPKYALPSYLVFAFLLFTWCTGYYYGFKYGCIWGALLLGVTRALMGINTMHASSHYAITHSPFVWRWLCWLVFDIFMGGSSLAWNYQHVIGHHQHTNVFQADPDLPMVEEGDMRRIVEPQKWKEMYRYQAFYLPFLYTLFAFKTRWTDLMVMLGDKNNGPVPMNVSTSQLVLLYVTKAFFVFYQFWIPYHYFQLPLQSLVISYVFAELAAGGWLAYFFQVNHVSEDVLYTARHEGDTTDQEWAQMQVESTVDYCHGDPIFTFLSGTLNYQVAHHLFPSVAPHHYIAIAPIIKRVCKKYDIPYQHHDSFWKACKGHFKELHRMGAAAANA